MLNTSENKNDFAVWIKHLNQVSEMILMNSSLDGTISLLLDTLNTSLSSIFVIHLKVDDKGKNLLLHSFSQKFFPQVNKLIKFNLYKIKYPLSNQAPLITRCLAKRKIFMSKNLKDFFYPVFKWPSILEMIQKLLNVNACMAVPMMVDNKPRGVFFVATVKKKFTQLEVELIKFYANQLRVAYDNKNKIEQLELQYLVEKETSAILAHELKTPLAIAFNSICVAAEHAKKRIKVPSSGFLMQAKDSVKKLNIICQSVLALREVETQKLSTIHELNLKSALLPIIKNFEMQAKEKKIKFNYAINFQKGKFYGGGVQFEQIVTILLDNALKYTEKGNIKIVLRSGSKKLTGIVCNTGYKIPRNKRKIIFNRFYRYQNKNQSKTSGLGLGLYIAQKLVDHLGGDLKVQDGKQKKETQFVVEIPIYKSLDREEDR